MKILFKGILALIFIFALVVLIESRLCMIYGISESDPLQAIFRVYFPK